MHRWSFVVLLILALAMTVTAHHSVNGTYDSTRPVTIKGTLTRIDWVNPHAWLFLQVTNENGQVATVRIEISGPGNLTRVGIDPNRFQIGKVISVEAWPPRDPQDSSAPRFAGRTVILDDGQRLDVRDRWGEQFNSLK